MYGCLYWYGKGISETSTIPVVATIGDSTFIHSGIPALIDCISVNANVTIIIMNNEITAMTGGQTTNLSPSKFKETVIGLGADPKHVKEIIPLKKNLDKNIKILKNEVYHHGLSVIISTKECIRK
jgi:indolepyruvate ferredoxin oxidoreductase, alpha subunit